MKRRVYYKLYNTGIGDVDDNSPDDNLLFLNGEKNIEK
jgi:hypothetical protein